MFFRDDQILARVVLYHVLLLPGTGSSSRMQLQYASFSCFNSFSLPVPLDYWYHTRYLVPCTTRLVPYQVPCKLVPMWSLNHVPVGVVTDRKTTSTRYQVCNTARRSSEIILLISLTDLRCHCIWSLTNRINLWLRSKMHLPKRHRANIIMYCSCRKTLLLSLIVNYKYFFLVE